VVPYASSNFSASKLNAQGVKLDHLKKLNDMPSTKLKSLLLML
jgi:hypothetical protein